MNICRGVRQASAGFACIITACGVSRRPKHHFSCVRTASPKSALHVDAQHWSPMVGAARLLPTGDLHGPDDIVRW
jgi:hypothetical protein